jgi:hypothetical protein
MDFITPIVNLGSTLIKRIFPDKADQDKATLELLKLQQAGDLKEIESQMSMIVAEASSQDKWTSRARPSFLYVVYIMILISIPMGVLFAFEPTAANNIEIGVRGWLEAIPKALYNLFEVGYLGYVGGRSFEKFQEIKTLATKKT